jgi:hypothetical protein
MTSASRDLPRGAKAFPDGWIAVPLPDNNILNVRVEPQGKDGEFVVTNVFVHGPRVTAETLRQVRPAQYESIVNYYMATSAALRKRTSVRVDTLPGSIFGAQQDDSRLTLDQLRKRQTTGTSWNIGELDDVDERLPRPDGTNPDAFYARVARAYRSAAARSPRPAVIIADSSDVPVNTVRTWIKEARRRGFLPKGTRQKGN